MSVKKYILDNPDTRISDGYGTSVVVCNNHLIIASPYKYLGKGAILSYVNDNGKWKYSETFSLSLPGSSCFGYKIISYNNILFISAIKAYGTGVVYMFTISNKGIFVQLNMLKPDNYSIDFGKYLAILGNKLYISDSIGNLYHYKESTDKVLLVDSYEDHVNGKIINLYTTDSLHIVQSNATGNVITNWHSNEIKLQHSHAEYGKVVYYDGVYTYISLPKQDLVYVYDINYQLHQTLYYPASGGFGKAIVRDKDLLYISSPTENVIYVLNANTFEVMDNITVTKISKLGTSMYSYNDIFIRGTGPIHCDKIVVIPSEASYVGKKLLRNDESINH